MQNRQTEEYRVNIQAVWSKRLISRSCLRRYRKLEGRAHFRTAAKLSLPTRPLWPHLQHLPAASSTWLAYSSRSGIYETASNKLLW